MQNTFKIYYTKNSNENIIASLQLRSNFRYVTKMDDKDEFIASESFKRHEITDNIDYIASAISKSTDNLSSIEKRMEEVCCSKLMKGIQSWKKRDGKMKTEAVSASLNSIYGEVKLNGMYNSLCGSVPASSLFIHRDLRDRSAWSL